MEDRQGEARSLTSLGDVWRDQGLLEEAIAAYEESLAIYGHLEGSRAGEAFALIRLAEALRLGGRWEEAAACYERGLGVARKLGDLIREVEALTGLGRLEAGRPSGDPGVTTAIGRRNDPHQTEAQ